MFDDIYRKRKQKEDEAAEELRLLRIRETAHNKKAERFKQAVKQYDPMISSLLKELAEALGFEDGKIEHSPDMFFWTLTYFISGGICYKFSVHLDIKKSEDYLSIHPVLADVWLDRHEYPSHHFYRLFLKSTEYITQKAIGSLLNEAGMAYIDRDRTKYE